MKPFPLGARLRDTVTGFDGLATVKTIYIGGRVAYLLEGPHKPDGTACEFWFDEGRLELFVKEKLLGFGPMPENATAAAGTAADPPTRG